VKAEIRKDADIVIIGAGAAGVFAALTLAPRKVVVISEGPCASAWAQGGFAAAVSSEDTPESHAADTLKAAAGTADAQVVRALTQEAPRHVALLEKYGVKFERDGTGAYKLSREACHGRRRVLKAEAGDGFGAEMMRALMEAARATPSIIFAEGFSAEQVLPRQGVLARRVADGAGVFFAAGSILIASGGLGGLYAATTNPLTSTGRGLALAARAGAVLSDLEFVQFHPTALDIGEDPAPLATEALRGEGAHLLNSRGERFMLDYHEMAELAPRDVVSRGIFAQMQRGQKVYLDCRRIDTARFPALLSACARANLDPKRDLIPVTPAVHYHMGGIATDMDGRTSVPGLWAAGEAASTGLHGANRLASNSLLEAVVMGGRAARDIAEAGQPARDIADVPALRPVSDMQGERELLREIMSDLVGVIRDEAGMKRALRDITAIETVAAHRDAKTEDMALVARLVALCALERTESRGAHARSDYMKPARAWKRRSYITLAEAAQTRGKEKAV
jgi:L-aspartate oxidase